MDHRRAVLAVRTGRRALLLCGTLAGLGAWTKKEGVLLLALTGLVISLDGTRRVRVAQSMRWDADCGERLAQQLGICAAEEVLAAGAEEIIREVRYSMEEVELHA